MKNNWQIPKFVLSRKSLSFLNYNLDMDLGCGVESS